MGGPEADKLNQISVSVARLEVTQEQTALALGKVSTSMDRLVDKLDRSDNIANKAFDRANSAHHRIDEANDRIKEVEGDIKWLWRTVIASILTGGIGGAIALLWKGVGP